MKAGANQFLIGARKLERCLDEMVKEKKVGEVTHFFDKISVAIIKVAKGQKIKVGDTLHYKNKKESTDFTENVDSMQLFKEPVEVAKAGEEVGVKVGQKISEGVEVFLV